MLRARSTVLASLVLSGLFAMPAPAADTRTQFLVRQLEKASDPRARAQAAAMLGASQSPDAIDPLCRASREGESVVRAAAVKGLTRFSEPRAKACVVARQKDPDPDVRAVALGTSGSAAPVAQRPSGKRGELYVSVGPVEDRSQKKGGASLSTMTTKELQNRLTARGALLAPESESQTQAKAVLAQKKLRGFYLMSNVDTTPTGGLKLTLVCFRYPERVLLGEVNVKAKGAPSDHLIRALVAQAVQDAAETFEWDSTP